MPIAILAARAKKDAYVEKPLGLTIEQDLACLKVFSETGSVFQYGTNAIAVPLIRIFGSVANWFVVDASAKYTRLRLLRPTDRRAVRPGKYPCHRLSITTSGWAQRR